MIDRRFSREQAIPYAIVSSHKTNAKGKKKAKTGFNAVVSYAAFFVLRFGCKSQTGMVNFPEELL
jgi:hypothetical protein